MGLGCGGEKVSREEEVKRATRTVECDFEMWRRCSVFSPFGSLHNSYVPYACTNFPPAGKTK